MSSVTSRVVQSLRMVCDTLIPDKHSSGLVAYTALKVLTLGNMVEKKAEEIVRLFIVKPHNPPGIDGIDICLSVSTPCHDFSVRSALLTKSLLFGNRVKDNNGMFLNELRSTHYGTFPILHLLRYTIVVRVDCSQPLESLPESRRK